MLHAIYSVYNEGVDHDNDTNNYHRHNYLAELYAHTLLIVNDLE